MEYTVSASPNPILEALTYLGARANGLTQAYLEKRFRKHGRWDIATLRERYDPIGKLISELDARVPLSEDLLHELFYNLPGFTDNRNGAFSPAILTLSRLACCRGDEPEKFFALITQRTEDEAAQDIMISLSLDLPNAFESVGAADRLMSQAFALPLPAESRLAVLELFHNQRDISKKTADCIRKVLAVLTEQLPRLQELGAVFLQEAEQIGYDRYLRAISSFHFEEGPLYRLRPMILNASANLIMEHYDGGYVVHCGILRHFLHDQASSSEASLQEIYEAIHLLGDRTRFDIFCYLLEHPAYGQELSDRFGLARNTIHHHMSKLYDVGLVCCTVEGSRIYYSVNKDRYNSLLDRQRSLLLGSYRVD